MSKIRLVGPGAAASAPVYPEWSTRSNRAFSSLDQSSDKLRRVPSATKNPHRRPITTSTVTASSLFEQAFAPEAFFRKRTFFHCLRSCLLMFGASAINCCYPALISF